MLMQSCFDHMMWASKVPFDTYDVIYFAGVI